MGHTGGAAIPRQVAYRDDGGKGNKARSRPLSKKEGLMIKKLVLVLLLMVMVGCGGDNSTVVEADIPWDDIYFRDPFVTIDCGLEQDQYGNWWNTCG